MPTYFAQNSGVNIDSVNQWNTAANGSGSFVAWSSIGAGDILVLNGKTNITINVNVSVAQITNAVVSGSTSGGTLLITSGGISVTATTSLFCITSANMITVSHSSGVVTITSPTIQSQNSAQNRVILVSGSGNCDVVGNIPQAVTFNALTATVAFGGSGNCSFTGNAVAGYSGGISPTTNVEGAIFVTNGSVTINGNVTGSNSNSGYGLFVSGGSCTVVGTVTGGSANSTVNCAAAGACVIGGTLTIFGTAQASSQQPAVTVDRTVSSTRSIYSGVVVIKGTLSSDAGGIFASQHPQTRIDPTSEVIFKTQITGGTTSGQLRSAFTGGSSLGYPAVGNVRQGTTFGNAGEYAGTLIVPNPAYVSLGVPTDNTVGTLSVDLTAITSRLPAALVGGRMDCSVGSMAAGVLTSTVIAADAITASAIATDAVGEIADGVWDEATSGHTTAGTYGGRIVRATNSNVTVQITGSNHISADVHAFQADVIDAAAIASSAVTEIQNGLATASQLTTECLEIKDRQGYTLAILAGSISNAGSPTETYVIDIGDIYTVAYSGLTSLGNRGGASLNKV